MQIHPTPCLSAQNKYSQVEKYFFLKKWGNFLHKNIISAPSL
jgi:hypothetical protein